MTSWVEQGGMSRLLGAGVALGLSLGASWQVALVMLVSLAGFVALGPRRPRLREVLATFSVLVTVGVAVSVYVMVRAGQNPALDWGHATTPSRYLALLRQNDFTATFGNAHAGSALSRLPIRMISYPAIISRDLGLAAVALGWLAWSYLFYEGHGRGWYSCSCSLSATSSRSRM